MDDADGAHGDDDGLVMRVMLMVLVVMLVLMVPMVLLHCRLIKLFNLVMTVSMVV